MNSIIDQILKYKNIFCFGAGAMGKDFADFLLDWGYDLNNVFFIDNDTKKHGMSRMVGDIEIPIMSKHWLIDNYTKNDAIVIATLACHEIYSDIIKIDKFQNTSIYFSQLIFTSLLKPTEKLKLTPTSDIPIPKIIHYCWFGGSGIPDKWKRFIEGWQEKCPDYEIKRWDENNYDITKNLYMKQAYEAKRYGFVSDYARLDIVYNFGGIYLDTDVELVQPLDSLLFQKAFFGIGAYLKVGTGCGFGAVPQSHIVKEMLNVYEDLKFFTDDLSINAVPCMEYQHAVLHKHGFKLNGQLQILDYTTILPFDILNCHNHYIESYSKSNCSIAVHHSERSWHDKKMRKRANLSVSFLNSRIYGY